MKRQVFSAKVERLGGWYIVRVPRAVSVAMGTRGHVPVAGKVNGVAFHKSLLPQGGGRHFMALEAKLRARAAIALGDRVSITLARDESPPEAATPPDLAFALRDVDALAAFHALTRAHRNHIIAWIDEAVMETTREKRIAKAVEVALAAREKALDRAAKARDKASERC